MPHNPEKLFEDVKLAVSEVLEFCEGSDFSRILRVTANYRRL
jgi:hypothetical protein